MSASIANPFTSGLTLPETISFTLARDGNPYTLRLADFDQETLLAALTHGFKQKINDKLNVAPKDGETPRSVADALVASLRTNGWAARTASTGSSSVDPFEKWLAGELAIVARARLKAAKATGGLEIEGIKYFKADREAVDAFVEDARENMPAQRLACYKALYADRMAAMADIDLD